MSRSNSTAGEASHILINYSGPSFSYLPRDILVNILHRLSVKRIFVCKCVCKTWNDLISDPEFAKFYSERAEVYTLFRIPQVSGNIYLVQPDKDDFEVKLDMCDHTGSNSECACHVKFELDTKFKLSECNHMTHDNGDSSHSMFDHDSEEETNKCVELDIDVEKYSIVNSCNGFICLSDPSNTNFIVCNPITGEFMKLPEAKKFEELGYQHNFGFTNGFGFSPATNEYKVIRMCGCVSEYEKGVMSGSVIEVHILGTESWKIFGFIPYLSCESVLPIYLNGFLYWFSILGFDIEKERIFNIATLSRRPRDYNPVMLQGDNSNGVGVLGGELCMTSIHEITTSSVAFSVWVLKDCSTKQEWSNVLSIELYSNLRRLDGPYQPIKYLNDGALLMFQPYNNAFIYKDPKKVGFRYLEVCGIDSPRWLGPKVEVIAHTPSLVSLKHALSLSGQNVKVLNFKSRCTELHNKGNDISIEEKEVEGKLEYDWGTSSESDDRELESDSDSEDRKIPRIDMKRTNDGAGSQESDHGDG